MVQKIGPLPVEVLNKYWREAGQQLSTTQTVPVICKAVTKGWQKCAKQPGSNAVELPSKVTLAALSVLLNFLDCSPEVAIDIVGEYTFLNTLQEILTFCLQERIQGKEMALATLASLIDGKESVIIQGKDELLKMFLETLERALQTSNRICLVDKEDWSAWECTLTIHRLARYHANKPLLVQMGCLPHLTKLAKIGTVDETKEAVGAIWFLAFDKDNQIKMLEYQELNIVDLLIDIKKKSEDKTTKEAADGIIWLLRGQLQTSEKYKDKEAEYAFQLHKKVVILQMEKDYKPNGWLGFIVGTEYFYDFSGKYNFETIFKELRKRIAVLFSEEGSETNDVTITKETHEDNVDAGPVSITQRSVARPSHQSSLANLREWTQKQVNDWLDQYNLSKEVFGHLTRKDLAALVRMKDNASEYFYRCLEKMFKIESLSTMDTFIDALENI